MERYNPTDFSTSVEMTEEYKNTEKILVTSKLNNDLDGTAGSMAYACLLKALGKNAEAYMFGPPHPETLYFIENHNLAVPQHADDGRGDWNKFIFTDASGSMHNVPKVIKAEKVTEVIDHRQTLDKNEFINATVQNEMVGAAATLIFEKVLKAGAKLPRETALALYGAIFHNSLNLLSSNTSPRDKEAATALEKEYGLNREIIKEMFEYIGHWTTTHLAEQLLTDVTVTSKFAVSQLIFTGVDKVLRPLEKEMEQALNTLRKKEGLDFVFLTTVDINNNDNIIFCSDKEGRAVISRALGVEFEGNWARRTPALLRKQIMPLVKAVIN